jgi:acetoacetyl-CoA synthetase
MSGTQLDDFARFCSERASRSLADPQELQRFSVEEFRRFWGLFLEWADPLAEGSPEPVCTDDRCEQALFFPNLRLNYAENLLRPPSPDDDERVVLVARHAGGESERITRRELRGRVRALAARYEEMGLREGDRVAAIAANNADAAVAGLAAATIGATFSSAAPDMGAPAVLARFEQLEPKLLLASLDRSPSARSEPAAERVAAIADALPDLRAVIALGDGAAPDGLEVPVHHLRDLLHEPAGDAEGEWRRFPFNHPLFILFTSGTTGPPKCIVHGAGGTLLEHLKEHRLHLDLGPEDTLFFQTSTAWMMWNWQLSALACGSRVVVFDGPLQGPDTLWEIVGEEAVTVFGTSPPYLQLCEEGGYSPRRAVPVHALRSVLSTGSVLRDRQYDWVEREVGPVRLQSISGGTDIIGCFVLGHPRLPVRRGMIQSRSLGLDVQALTTESTPSGSKVGELVCRNPFPSRPLGLLGDDGERFHDAYFSQNPGVWTHGDLIEFDEDGQSRIHGRSDGVLNIQGVRIGPAEIYEALRDVTEVREAMAVEQAREGGSRIVLLLVLREGAALDGGLIIRIRRAIAAHASALYVPELMVAVGELPVTHSGKRSERAGRDAVSGLAAVNSEALANPGTIERIRSAVSGAEAARVDRDPGEMPEGASTIEKLRAIWEAVLGVEPIADDDAFFELGGTSLQALELFLMIETKLATALPLSAILEAPTLGELAAVVDDPSIQFEPLVLMRPGSGFPPLYFVHSIWGDVLGMRQVALAIEADIPVYGIRARGINAGEEPQRSVEEMAATYVDLIRDFQAHGPYRVAGHSFSGLVAFEIARQLIDRGEEVEWLGIIDAELSTAALPPRRRLAHRAALPFHLARAALADPRAAVTDLFRNRIPNLARRAVLLVFPHARISQPPPRWVEGASPGQRQLAEVFLEAADAFRPRPYRGDMTYFRPAVRRYHLYADPLPVWRKVTEGAVEVETVPGPHVGMTSGDRGRRLAAKIDARL